MARKMNKKTAAQERTIVEADELKRIVKEYERQAAHASEYAGHAGNVVKQAVERYHLDRKAIRFVLGLAKMEETKRQATLRAVMEYAHKLDMFASVDAFDDVIDTMETIVSEARGNEGRTRPADPIVSSLVN